MLIYFEPTTMCNMPDDFILAPLPARKQLWEAADEFSWEAESHKEPGAQAAFALAADGEVVRLAEDRLSCCDAWLPFETSSAGSGGQPTDVANWEEWCSGMDGFGSLVMLAASFMT